MIQVQFDVAKRNSDEQDSNGRRDRQVKRIIARQKDQSSDRDARDRPESRPASEKRHGDEPVREHVVQVSTTRLPISAIIGL